MVSLGTPGLEASVVFIFLYYGDDFGDMNEESGTLSLFFMFFSSLFCSIPTLLYIFYN